MAQPMFHMLSCFDLKPDEKIGAFRTAYTAFIDQMKRIGLVESTGPIGNRQRDTPMPISRSKPGDSADGSIYDAAARTIETAGFNVIRDPILGQARFKGATFDTNYLNWLVGNGFVIAVGFDNAETDAAARQRIEGYFPERDVFIVEMLESWNEGGGVHCHTNDEPAIRKM